ncbi:MAG TPA: hypothetical protein VLL69_03940 [Streptosporangiaceae bacterium]|nr:hypothetical protein [Streptosporangiaceae bacterium]
MRELPAARTPRPVSSVPIAVMARAVTMSILARELAGASLAARSSQAWSSGAQRPVPGLARQPF